MFLNVRLRVTSQNIFKKLMTFSFMIIVSPLLGDSYRTKSEENFDESNNGITYWLRAQHIEYV